MKIILTVRIQYSFKIEPPQLCELVVVRRLTINGNSAISASVPLTINGFIISSLYRDFDEIELKKKQNVIIPKMIFIFVKLN
jgi:hypothetical protein